MRGKSQVVVVVACLALTGCAAAMQYTVTADLFIQPSRAAPQAKPRPCRASRPRSRPDDFFDCGSVVPAATVPAATNTSRSSDHASREGDAAHRGTVLVMDDQVGVRASVRAISEEMCDLGEAEDG